MGVFCFHLIGPSEPIELEVAAPTIGDLHKEITGGRFLEGRLTQPDGDGVLADVLVATSRIQCVIAAS